MIASVIGSSCEQIASHSSTMYGASVCHLRHLGPDRITSTDGSSINVFFLFPFIYSFSSPAISLSFSVRNDSTSLACLVPNWGCLSSLGPWGLWNPGMVECHYLDSTLSLNLSRTSRLFIRQCLGAFKN